MRTEVAFVRSQPNIGAGLGFKIEDEGAEHGRIIGTLALEKSEDDKLYVNGLRVIRYVSPSQKIVTIDGYNLREELKGVRVLNACFIEVLLATPEIIPYEWRAGYTHFWGTVFRHTDGKYVGYLYWIDDKWHFGFDQLNGVFGLSDPAACLAWTA